MTSVPNAARLICILAPEEEFYTELKVEILVFLYEGNLFKCEERSPAL